MLSAKLYTKWCIWLKDEGWQSEGKEILEVKCIVSKKLWKQDEKKVSDGVGLEQGGVELGCGATT